jgi:hypothetical protein
VSGTLLITIDDGGEVDAEHVVAVAEAESLEGANVRLRACVRPGKVEEMSANGWTKKCGGKA